MLSQEIREPQSRKGALNLHRKDAKAQRKRKGKQKHLRLKSKEVDSRATAIYRLDGGKSESSRFLTCFIWFPLRFLCAFAPLRLGF
jgi:hypothetical protein